jgi:hypothetical protein
MMIPETEQIEMLRHRFARTLEIGVAYKVFLKREIEIGAEKTCITNQLAQQITSTLLVTYYSYIHSLFDASGTDFIKITEPFLRHLDRNAINCRDRVILEWNRIKKPIEMIRHNIGFHNSRKASGTARGYHAYKDISPLSSEVIVQLLRVFFRYLYDICPPKESYAQAPEQSDTLDLFKIACELQDQIKQEDINDMINAVADYFRKKN